MVGIIATGAVAAVGIVRLCGLASPIGGYWVQSVGVAGGSSGRKQSMRRQGAVMRDAEEKLGALVAECRQLGLDGYRERLVERREPAAASDGYDIPWGDLQDMKSRSFDRLARFVELVKAGVEAEAALERAWEEIPAA